MPHHVDRDFNVKLANSFDIDKRKVMSPVHKKCATSYVASNGAVHRQQELKGCGWPHAATVDGNRQGQTQREQRTAKQMARVKAFLRKSIVHTSQHILPELTDQAK